MIPETLAIPLMLIERLLERIMGALRWTRSWRAPCAGEGCPPTA